MVCLCLREKGGDSFPTSQENAKRDDANESDFLVLKGWGVGASVPIVQQVIKDATKQNLTARTNVIYYGDFDDDMFDILT